MVDYNAIHSTLILLDKEYSNTTHTTATLYATLMSKLAVLEFCGWIEDSFDVILKDYVNSHLIRSDCISSIDKNIKRNYGFDYDNNLCKIFPMVIGINNWENIIDKMGSNLVIFTSKLSTYRNMRNNAAHTHTQLGVTMSYQTPSAMLAEFNIFKPLVVLMETEISNL